MNQASAETPPPTPRELPQKEPKRAMDHSDHPAKRLKQRSCQEEAEAPVGDHIAPVAGPQYQLPPGAQTPATPSVRTESLSSMGSSSVPSEQDRSSIPGTPAPMVDRKPPSASPSDLSSTSRAPSMLSPVTPFVHHELPPAPPSTPASDSARSVMHGTNYTSTTPLPYQALKNADQLERQQLLQDGVATPAPTKPAQPPRAKPQSLIDDFSDWAVGNRYNLQRMLGRGSYGEVAQAIDLKQGRADAFVAIKRIRSPFDQEIDSVRLFREIHLLRRLRGHECIIQLLDVVQPPTDDLADFHDLYLVFECESC